MAERSRRRFLQSASTLATVGIAGCAAPAGRENHQTETERDDLAQRESSNADRETTTDTERSDWGQVDVRGALYVPSRAWNTFQMWHEYDERVIERDLGYAATVDINAIRTWVSYEQWQEDADLLERRIEHFLRTADGKGMRVLFGLFESVGKEPTESNLHATDPLKAPPVQSPSSDVITNQNRWDAPREYVRWFMERWRDDERLLAVEVMNEPGWLETMKRFAAGMFETLAEERGAVPLTVGSTSLANNADYVDWGADVLQFHYNFPSDRDRYHELLSHANRLGRDLDMPVYLSEWQRVANFGWGDDSTVEEWQPKYASLAPVIHEHGTGNFFWSLMVKPAYVRYMRKRGIINGLFHEDGTVWNLEDARAIKAMSGDPEVELEQRREWPEWAEKVKRHAFGGG